MTLPSMRQLLSRMLTGVVASETYLKEHFQIQDAEAQALSGVLQWLRHNSPWFDAYTSSLKDASKCMEFCKSLASDGCLLASAQALHTADEAKVSDALGMT